MISLRKICIAALAAAAMAASANSYIYWMVDETGAERFGEYGSVKVRVSGGDIDGAAYLDISSANGETALGKSAMHHGDVNSVDQYWQNRWGFWADLGDYVGDSYSYAVEFYDADGVWHGETSSLAYADAVAGGYVVSTGIGEPSSSMWSVVPSVVVAAIPSAATGLVYDGTPQTGVADGTGYTVADGTATSAGGHTATATLDANFVWSDRTTAPKTIEWSISKAKYAMDGVTFADGNATYNGQSHSLAISGTLPDGVSVGYENNDQVAAGEYTVVAKFTGDADNYEPIADMTATLAIARANATVTADSKSKTYGEDDPALTAVVTGTYGHDVIAYTLARAEGDTVGTYTITASGDAVQGSYNVAFAGSTFSISKARYAMDGVTFADGNSTYDGQSHSLAISGTLPDGVTVGYENNDQVAAGEYTVVAKFTGDADNYEPIADMTATLAIARANATVTADSKSKTYGEADPALTAVVTGTYGDDVIAYTLARAEGDTVGTYTITASGDAVQDNYNVAFAGSTFSISKAKYAMDGVTFADGSATYDGQAHSLAISGTLPDGVSVGYENNDQVAAGEYTVTAKFTGDADNYEPIADMTATLSISQKPITVTADNKTKWLGDPDPEFTFQVTDGELVAGEELAGSLTWDKEETEGDHDIVQSDDWGNGNYAITFVPGKLHIDSGVAMIGDEKYQTLAAAYEAANAGDTIVLRTDCEGNGISIKKAVTIDFAGFTYTVVGNPAGSEGTKSQAFQILAEAGRVTFRNGTITSTEAVKMLVNNYADLTLDGMTLDGTKMGVAHKAGTDAVVPNYTLSNNNGATTLAGATTITSKGAGHFAMDTYDSAGYEGVPSVVVDGVEVVINGDVELTGGNLALKAGTLNGNLLTDAKGIRNGVVAKSADFAADPVVGYLWNADGVLVLAPARIGDAYYLTLAAAYEAANAGDTIVLCSDCEGNGISIKKSVTIDFAGFTYTVAGNPAGSEGTKSQAFQILAEAGKVTFRNGTITSTEAVKMLVNNYADLTLDCMTLDGTKMGVAHSASTGAVVPNYTLSNNNGATTLAGATTITSKGAGHFAMDTYDSANYEGVPSVVVDGAEVVIDGDVELTGGNLALKAGTLNGRLVAGSKGIGKGVVAKSGDFVAGYPENYIWGDDGVLAMATAKIGGVSYATLEEAVNAATDGSTVELLCDAVGNGVIVGQDRFAGKGLTIDFGGFTYTMDGDPTGSAGTKTQAFHFEQGNAIALVNGAITSTSAKMLVQNYCDLSLANITLDGQNLLPVADGLNYTLSNNCGSTVIGEGAVVIASKGGVAFDASRWGSYKSVSVELDGGRVIGNIEVSTYKGAADGVNLVLTSGEIDGKIVYGHEGDVDGVVIRNGGAVEVRIPAGCVWGSDGVLGKAKVKIVHPAE